MCSDDTEHTLFVAQALLAHPGNPAMFQACLARKLRLWIMGVPAGIGFATLRAILKLWIGFPPGRSGVFSAGNGPAMRSAIIGAYFAGDEARRRQFVSAATRVTHTEPKAEIAALAVAEAAAWACTRPEPNFLSKLSSLSRDNEWQSLCEKLRQALARGDSVGSFAEELGLQKGVSGYAYHSVPVALYAWLRHLGDFSSALKAGLDCGGDTDTVGAIIGALAGTTCGEQGIPAEWVGKTWEWPRSCGFIRQVATRLAQQSTSQKPLGPVRYCWPGVIPRNILFLLVVLTHGFMRMTQRS